MKKALFTVLLILFCVLSVTATAQNRQRFVRKKVQPNFFIPNGALAESKPEKVYIPRYNAGETTAKRISADDNKPVQRPVVLNNQVSKQTPETTTTPTPAAEKPYTPPTTPAPSQVDDGTPNYQKMYQDYLRDLDTIANTGNINDQAVLSDLDAMNSEKRIEIDKKFNKNRNIQNEIQSVLKN